MQEGRNKSYTQEIVEYQDKQYLPDSYHGRIHPAVRAKTRTGGYFMVISGIVFFLVTVVQMYMTDSFSLVDWILPLVVSVLLIVAGGKVLKANTPKRK